MRRGSEEEMVGERRAGPAERRNVGRARGGREWSPSPTDPHSAFPASRTGGKVYISNT